MFDVATDSNVLSKYSRTKTLGGKETKSLWVQFEVIAEEKKKDILVNEMLEEMCWK